MAHDALKKEAFEYLEGLTDIDEIDEFKRIIDSKIIEDEVAWRVFQDNFQDALRLMKTECIVCRNPLIHGVGEKSYGFISYECECSQTRRVHSQCGLTMSVVPKCAFSYTQRGKQ